MRGRLLELLIALYPATWRRRYGNELRELVSQLARSGRRSRVALALGLLNGAAREWWRGYRWQISGAVGAAAITAGLVLALGGGAQPGPRLEAQRPAVHGRQVPRAPLPQLTPAQPCSLNYNPQDGSGNSCGSPACSEPISTDPTAPQQVMPATGARRARRQCASTYVPRSGKSVEIAGSY